MRPSRKGPEAEARGYEADAETEAKILASKALTSLLNITQNLRTTLVKRT